MTVRLRTAVQRPPYGGDVKNRLLAAALLGPAVALAACAPEQTGASPEPEPAAASEAAAESMAPAADQTPKPSSGGLYDY